MNHDKKLEFNFFIKNFSTEYTIHPTLGGRSSFFIKRDEQKLVIKNSKSKEYIIDNSIFESVYNRFKNAATNNKYKAGYYSIGKWKNSPAKVVCPYVVSLIKGVL